MVTMKNIRRIDNVISMDCYAEGKEEGHFYLELDETTCEIITNSLSEMNAYVFQAWQKIREYVQEGKELPDRTISMWY